MRNVVVANIDKIDFDTTVEKVNLIDSLDQLREGMGTYLLSPAEVTSDTIFENSSLFVPFEMLQNVKTTEKAHVYFDLEQYPFFKKAIEMISKDEKPKGVFRYRRISKNDRFIEEDFFVLASLLGEPQEVKVKRTNRSVLPFHTIITVNFGGGTMAHLEYTVAESDRIELEWSGIKNIIEFNSDEMTPINPKHSTALPLSYNVDSILETAHKVDADFLKHLEKYSSLINGGAIK